jgi:hypothetical protein
MSEQLTLQLQPGLATRYRSAKEAMAAGVYQRGVVYVAGKIDRQPSHLSEALSGSDRRKLDLDEFERYVEETGDITPVLYLVDKFLRDPKARQQAAIEQLALLVAQVPGLAEQAGLAVAARRRR